jgi:hypothetical protein
MISIPVILETKTLNLILKEKMLLVRIKEYAEFSLSHVKENICLINDLLGIQKLPILVDANAFFIVTKDGLAFSTSGPKVNNMKAVAFFSKGLGSQLKLQYYIDNTPNVKIGMFKNRVEADIWLDSLR